MLEPNKLTNPNWGWTSGMALGLGSAAGVAWGNWGVFVAVTMIVAGLMIWRAQ